MPIRDQIARCLLGGGAVRVVVATTTDTVREACRRHQALGSAAVALGRASTAGLLLATLTKDEERVSVQVLGDGPLGGVTVDASSSGRVRAFLKNPAATLPGVLGGESLRLSLRHALGRNGVVSVIRDLGMKRNFSGQTSLVSGEIDEDVQGYLENSEQIDSVLRCDAVLSPDMELKAAGGILIQTLPEAGGADLVREIREHVGTGALADALAANADDGGLSAEQLARAVLGPLAASLQVLDVRPVTFHCPCSRERATTSLALLGVDELAAMIAEDGRAEVTCNFCRERYDFTEAELEAIRRQRQESSDLPS